MKNIISLALLALGLFGITAAQSQAFLGDGLGNNYRVIFIDNTYNTPVVIQAVSLGRCMNAQNHVISLNTHTLVQACHAI